MVAHQHPSVHSPASPLTDLAERSDKKSPILSVAEDAFSPVPARHDVKSSRVFNANSTSYDPF
jgi:hypothetical protein